MILPSRFINTVWGSVLLVATGKPCRLSQNVLVVNDQADTTGSGVKRPLTFQVFRCVARSAK
jgi:hypothetical protein